MRLIGCTMLVSAGGNLRCLSDSADRSHQCAHDERQDPEVEDAKLPVISRRPVVSHLGNNGDRPGLFQGACVGNADASLGQAHGVAGLSDHVVVVDATKGDVHRPDDQLVRPVNRPHDGSFSGSNRGPHRGNEDGADGAGYTGGSRLFRQNWCQVQGEMRTL